MPTFLKSDKNKNKIHKTSMLKQILMSSISKFIYIFSHTHFINEIDKKGSMSK